MDDNNVIEFPFKKRILAAKQQKIRFDLEQKRVLVSASLVSILVMVTMVNYTMVPKNTEKGESTMSSRAVASLDNTYSKRNSDWQSKIVEKLALKKNRGLATAGNPPTILEELSFGKLGGKYAVRMESGKLSEITFSDANGSGDSPKYIRDRVKFLRTYRSLLPVKFSAAKRVRNAFDQGKVFEVYHLIGADQLVVGQVEFRMDTFGRMLSMKVITQDALSSL